jgi:hypothetical protein
MREVAFVIVMSLILSRAVAAMTIHLDVARRGSIEAETANTTSLLPVVPASAELLKLYK